MQKNKLKEAGLDDELEYEVNQQTRLRLKYLVVGDKDDALKNFKLKETFSQSIEGDQGTQGTHEKEESK